MKRFLLTLFFLFPFLSLFAVEIVIPKGAKIYKIGQLETPYFSNNTYPYNYYYSIDKEVVLKKSITVPDAQIRILSTGKYYDGYSFNYKGKLFCVEKDNVIDNTYIDAKNEEMKSKLDSLKNIIEAQKDTILRIQREKSDKMSELYEFTDEFGENSSFARYNKVNDRVKSVIAEKKKIIYNSLSPRLKGYFDKVLYIKEARLAYPNSVGGCDYEFDGINQSSKTIKYLYISGNTYNRVGDLAYCEIQQTSFFRLEDVGPYKPGQDVGGNWETIIYNFSADEFYVKNLKIIYTDNTTNNFSFTKKEWKEILDYLEYGEVWTPEYDEIKKQIEKELHYDNFQERKNKAEKEIALMKDNKSTYDAMILKLQKLELETINEYRETVFSEYLKNGLTISILYNQGDNDDLYETELSSLRSIIPEEKPYLNPKKI